MYLKLVGLVLLVVGVQSNSQQDCAQLVLDKITEFLTKSQIVQVLSTITDDVYNQKSNKEISDNVQKKIQSIVTATQSSTFLTAYNQLKTDLGDDFDKVMDQLTNAVYGTVGKLATKLKKQTKKNVKAGKSKEETMDALYTKSHKLAESFIKKGMDACKKAITSQQWKFLTKDMAKILKFELYT